MLVAGYARGRTSPLERRPRTAPTEPKVEQFLVAITVSGSRAERARGRARHVVVQPVGTAAGAGERAYTGRRARLRAFVPRGDGVEGRAAARLGTELRAVHVRADGACARRGGRGGGERGRRHVRVRRATSAVVVVGAVVCCGRGVRGVQSNLTLGLPLVLEPDGDGAELTGCVVGGLATDDGRAVTPHSHGGLLCEHLALLAGGVGGLVVEVLEHHELRTAEAFSCAAGGVVDCHVVEGVDGRHARRRVGAEEGV